MTDTKLSPPDSSLYFISLKVAGTSTAASNNTGVFDDRSFSDEILSSLIYCIDHEKLELFGFLILSTQVYLIISPGEKELEKTIEAIKSATARRILHLAGKKMTTSGKGKTGEQLWLRRYFSQFINTGVTSFWQNDVLSNALRLKVDRSQLNPLTTQILRENLDSPTSNYLHLGAEAFTKLMLDSMKL
ncbi:MAG: hypothetical protein U5K79_13785 [Cyclobacteriaceae bacterium]|nr:hypothetical protein [Cyclobacteriaceae bacterium]